MYLDIKIKPLIFAAVLLISSGMFISYILSYKSGYLSPPYKHMQDPCNSYNYFYQTFIKSCTDITSTGTFGFPSIIFKTTIIPSSAILIAISLFLKKRILELNKIHSHVVKNIKFKSNVIFYISTLGCISLIISTACLVGSDTYKYRALHIITTGIFFASQIIQIFSYTKLEYRTRKIKIIKDNYNIDILLKNLSILLLIIILIISFILTMLYKGDNLANSPIVYRLEFWGVHLSLLWIISFLFTKDS